MLLYQNQYKEEVQQKLEELFTKADYQSLPEDATNLAITAGFDKFGKAIARLHYDSLSAGDSFIEKEASRILSHQQQ